MIVYQVELAMDAALRDEYLAWLRRHVAEMLTLPGFTGAELLQSRDPPPPAGRWSVCVQYRLVDWQAWQTYLAGHAPRMRAAGIARFGARVQATRRLLETP